MEIVKLNNGLYLELQISLKAPTDMRPPVDYFIGGAYMLYSLISSWA
jgi:hypothetical protein